MRLTLYEKSLFLHSQNIYMHSTIYLLLSGILFLALGIIWSKKSSLNALIKVILIGMGIWAIVLFLMESGYVVRT